jgi:hypothetical protein
VVSIYSGGKILDVSLKKAAGILTGIVATAIANDRFIFPFVAKQFPGLVGQLGTTQQRAINGATTFATAAVGGLVLHEIEPEFIGAAAVGGGALGLGRVALSPVGGNISVAVPGLSQMLSAQLTGGSSAAQSPASTVPGNTASAQSPATGTAPLASAGSPSSYL